LQTSTDNAPQLLGFGQPDTSGGFVQRGNTITNKPLNSEKPVYAIYEQNPYNEDVYQIEPIYKTMDRSIVMSNGRLLPTVSNVTRVITEEPGIT
jgi:hypothetical protein